MKYIELVKGLFTSEHEARAKQLDPYVAYSKEADSFMFTIAPEPYVGPADNEIWYTSSDGNIVTPYSTSVFRANIVNNTYENGKGVITFDGPVTSIGYEAFNRCSKLTSIAIPNSVTSIGYYAFCNCYSLTSVTIPNNVPSISSYAFGGCESLTSITIPNSVTYIGEEAFNGCSSLHSVTINSDAIVNKVYTSSSNLEDVFGSRITEYILGDVKGIGDNAFYNCTYLTSVTISDSVTSIGSRAFWGSGITSVTIPNSVTSIGSRAFQCCSSLTSINVDSNNPNYSSIDGVLFNKDRTTLIQYLGGKRGAYTIPDSVTSIGSLAFSRCNNLTAITIPNSVTKIEEEAFDECSQLTSMTIGNGVTSIGDSAFYWCFKLASITCEAVTPPKLGVSNDVSSVTAVYVPAESVDAYKSANNWSYYADKIQPIQ